MNNFASSESISKYLEGKDPEKYIVSVEAEYYHNEVSRVINPPNGKKQIKKGRLKPFLFMKESALSVLYGGNITVIKREMRKNSIKVKALKVEGPDGLIPERIDSGFKYKVYSNSLSYSQLTKFFKDAGCDVFGETKYFLAVSPAEQYLIQTGKRLFKGMEEYDDVHRLQFDIETSGLNPKRDRIFQIGVKDNRGYEKVLEITGDTKKELRFNEQKAIKSFFDIIEYLKPDIIAGYNSEFFDWTFFFKRCELFNINIKDFAKTLNPTKKEIYRRKATIKFGAETENFEQTTMWGYNIIDVAHAVRKAQAINSEIKGWGLKYITKYSDAAKPNRVYVPGDKIYETWSDVENKYAFNNINGEWYVISDIKPIIDGFTETTGAYIVERYLLDDLWETEQVDNKFNQASFLLSKIVPTTLSRSMTMGTASLWKLLMVGWSYENNLTIPDYEPKRNFTGGLSRLLEVGYAKNVVKLDYAALYPNIELTHDIFPSLDISGVMKGMLLYMADTRNKYKYLMNEAKSKGDFKTADFYDKKQLPIKILANSFFGSLGAPYIFPWGDMNCAEETTCRGRQYLRLMVKHFTDNYGFRPLVGDTDGFNFAIPDEVNDIEYLVKGTHGLTERYVGKKLKGVDAVVADFNEKYMIGRMGLDIDDICTSTINFSRKNYANNILKGKTKDGNDIIKLKTVGNTIKSKKMPTYIEEFLAEGIGYLLDDNGEEFIELYYDYVNKIFNYEIPLMKIASKAKVKLTNSEYNDKCNQVNVAGNPMPRQAHMELIKEHDLKPGLGDTIFYVNIGTTKSHGDIKTIKDKLTGDISVELRCKLISQKDMEINPNLTTDEYNVPKYLDMFNKRIAPLLVCFNPEIRDKIIITAKKDKTTKEFVLESREYFESEELTLTKGHPIKVTDQDSYEDLMAFQKSELEFWTSVNKIPNSINENEWNLIKNKFIANNPEHRDKINKEITKTKLKSFIGSEPEPDKLTTPECDELLKVEYDEYVNNFGNLLDKHGKSKVSEYKEIALNRKMWYIINPDKTFFDWLEYFNKKNKVNQP